MQFLSTRTQLRLLPIAAVAFALGAPGTVLAQLDRGDKGGARAFVIAGGKAQDKLKMKTANPPDGDKSKRKTANPPEGDKRKGPGGGEKGIIIK